MNNVGLGKMRGVFLKAFSSEVVVKPVEDFTSMDNYTKSRAKIDFCSILRNYFSKNNIARVVVG